MVTWPLSHQPVCVCVNAAQCQERSALLEVRRDTQGSPDWTDVWRTALWAPAGLSTAVVKLTARLHSSLTLTSSFPSLAVTPSRLHLCCSYCVQPLVIDLLTLFLWCVFFGCLEEAVRCGSHTLGDGGVGRLQPSGLTSLRRRVQGD